MNQSLGRTCEVVVATNDTAMSHIVGRQLQMPVPGLPQEEPMFDVSTARLKGLSPTLLRSRTLVTVELGATPDGKTTLTCKHNVHATPQLIILITSPSVDALRRDIDSVGQGLRRLIMQHETAIARQQLEKKHNEKARLLIEERFGIDMLVPDDLTSWKEEPDFLWLSNDSPTAMLNICIYIYKGIGLGPGQWMEVRDSVMRRNIPGEEEGMYMTTATATESNGIILRGKAADGSPIEALQYWGLWEMKGDMMGGPFAGLSVADTVNHRVVMAETFVYAPGKAKRNLMLRGETALQTLKITGQNAH